MHKILIVVMGLAMSFCVSLTVTQQGQLQWSTTVPVAQAGGMQSIQLILKKLRGSMASMKDLDALEKSGMDKADVDRMRTALKQKIKQMTNDAVGLIRSL